MQVIPPVLITDAKLTSSTIPEAVAATYSGATPYGVGDLAGAASVYGSPQTVWRSKQAANTGNAQVEGAWWTEAGIVYPVYNSGSSCGIGGIVTDLANHDLYESLIASNTGHAPSDTDSWKYIGKTNRWRMFDYTRSEKSSVPLQMTIVFAPGKRINSFALAGMVANSYSLTITSVTGGGTVYSKSGSLNTRNTQTWSDYFFGEFGTMPSTVYFDIPPYSDCIVTLVLTATSGNVQLGAIVVGTYVYLGATQYTSSSDVLNFSTIDRDIDGNAILTQRRNVPKTRSTVWCNKNKVNKAIEVREHLNATPAIWYGIDDQTDGYFEALSILGIYKGFEINVDMPENAILSIELEQI